MNQKKYNIIYADVPWNYRDKANAGKRGASHKYKTMTLSDICALPVSRIAADNCCLFFWVTMPQLFNAERVMNAWGFSYKTCAFTWVKMNKKKPTPFMGMGNWTRSNSELCLLGTKGKPKRVSASVHSVIMKPITKHSEKPPIIREKIIELCGDVPRVELFGRGKAAEGWDIWGDESEDSIDIFQNISCDHCHGTGHLEDYDGHKYKRHLCPHCKGSGKYET